jgi:hypothetical protein
LYLYRLLSRDEEAAATGMLWAMLAAARYTVLAQVGNYLGVKSASITRLSPGAGAKFHRFMTKGWGP